MANTFDVPDPSDWLTTPVASLAPVENALRCQVCKDFFTTPVMTSCSHTFCSLCIRRCLTSDGKCPACRAGDQEIKLRPNWVVQELVESFQAARPQILKLGKDAGSWAEAAERPNKRRRTSRTEVADSDEDFETSPPRRKTRSQRTNGGPASRNTSSSQEEPNKSGGLAACPICNKRMKEEEVFPHLDIHNESNEASLKTKITPQNPQGKSAVLSSRNRPAPMSRLPQLNYSLLNEAALRKKLDALGIPATGPRSLLIRRHTEWMNIVNANCDSKTPRAKRDLLHELDIWERSQGRQLNNSTGSASGSIMDKDFDKSAWASKHTDDFQKLIAEARKRKKAASDAVGNNSTQQDSGHVGIPQQLQGPLVNGQSRIEGQGQVTESAEQQGLPHTIDGTTSKDNMMIDG